MTNNPGQENKDDKKTYLNVEPLFINDLFMTGAPLERIKASDECASHKKRQLIIAAALMIFQKIY